MGEEEGGGGGKICRGGRKGREEDWNEQGENEREYQKIRYQTKSENSY